jgi:hypothetical protein
MTFTALRRWLRSDAGDVVRIVSAQRVRERDRLGLRNGLPRWRRRIARQRVAALVRRRLLVGLVLAAVLELLAAAAGASARGLWLILPGLATLLGIAAAARTRVEPAEAALLLDRQLGLSERLITALGLAPAEAASGKLGALLLREADEAIDDSLARSRASNPDGAREWLAVLTVALLLAGALALGGNATRARSQRPAQASASDRSGVKSAATPARAARTAGSRSIAASARARDGSQAHQLTGSSRAAAGHRAQPTGPGRAGGRDTVGRGHTEAANMRTGAPARAEREPTPNSRSRALAALGAGHSGAAPAGTASRVGVKGMTARTGAPGASAKADAAGLAGSAAHTGHNSSATLAASRSSAGSPHAAAGSPHAGAGSPHAAAGSPHAGAGPAGARGAAGATARQAADGANRAAMREAAGTATLPVQSGYAASHQPRASSHALAAGSGGRSESQAQGELADSSGPVAGAASFAFIPFASPGVPSFDTPLLLGYFGPPAPLTRLSW